MTVSSTNSHLGFRANIHNKFNVFHVRTLYYTK
jgi:hypothetical protein